MIEFTFVAGVIVLILMGVFDLGRAIYFYNVINNTAHEAARGAIVCGGVTPTDCSSHDASVKTKAVGTTQGVPITTADVSISPSSRKYGDTVTAAVTVIFTPITPLIGSVTGSSMTLNATSKMVVQ
jgi:Flp pilus assembly protein TadG